MTMSAFIAFSETSTLAAFLWILPYASRANDHHHTAVPIQYATTCITEIPFYQQNQAL